MPLGLFCPFSGATVGLLELLTHCGQKDAEDSGGALVYSRWWWGFAWSRHWRSRQLSLAVYLSVRDASPSTYVRCFVCAAKMNLPSGGRGVKLGHYGEEPGDKTSGGHDLLAAPRCISSSVQRICRWGSHSRGSASCWAAAPLASAWGRPAGRETAIQ